MAETREQIRKSIQGSRGLFVCSFPDNEACADAKRQLAEKDKRIGDLVGKVHQIDAIWAVQVNALSRGNNELKRDNASLLAIIKKHEDWIDQHGKTQWGIVERLEKENVSLKARLEKAIAKGEKYCFDCGSFLPDSSHRKSHKRIWEVADVKALKE